MIPSCGNRRGQEKEVLIVQQESGTQTEIFVEYEEKLAKMEKKIKQLNEEVQKSKRNAELCCERSAVMDEQNDLLKKENQKFSIKLTKAITYIRTIYQQTRQILQQI